MPPSYREPRGECQREVITRRLPTLESLTKGFSPPEENPFADCFFPTKEMPRKAAENTNPGSPAGILHPSGSRPVAAFVAAYVPSCHRGRRRVRTALPGAKGRIMHSQRVVAFATTIARRQKLGLQVASCVIRDLQAFRDGSVRSLATAVTKERFLNRNELAGTPSKHQNGRGRSKIVAVLRQRAAEC